ncbi:MAG TPA: alpha-2-macroglobulin family protein, partial [Acidobacteriota bacterium]|nr:alpha-2-macroglobulin family protein [Acidobacteriota bacterium]
YHWTDQDGTYLINDLPPGRYEITLLHSSNIVYIYDTVGVTSGKLNLVDAVIGVREITEAEIGRMQSKPTFMNMWYAPNYFHTTPMLANRKHVVPVSTQNPPTLPKLRQDFTETALWAPLLATNHQGRVRVKLKFPNVVTTWKLSVVALTADGQIIEKEESLPVGKAIMPCECEK